MITFSLKFTKQSRKGGKPNGQGSTVF